MAWSLHVQSQQLPTESQVFEDEVLAGTTSADHPAEEMSERRDHSNNLIGINRIQLFAKSFILQVYDVLARQLSTEDFGQEAGPRSGPGGNAADALSGTIRMCRHERHHQSMAAGLMTHLS
jgi:hypothetical protein